MNKKYILPFCAPLLFVIPLVFGWFDHTVELIPLPQEFKFYAYSDSSEVNGNSTIYSSSGDNNTLSVQYIMRSGYDYPYAGLKIEIKDHSDLIDLTNYSRILIEVSSEPTTRIAIHIYCFLEGVSQRGEIDTYRVYRSYVDLKSGTHQYKLNLEDFSTPIWWLEQNGINLTDLTRGDRSGFAMIAIADGDFQRVDIDGELSFSQITFSQRPDRLIYGIWSLIVLYYLTLIILTYRRKNEKKNIIVLPSDVVTEKKGRIDPVTQEIVDFLAENFSNSQIGISELSSSINIPTTQINTILKQYSSLTFVAYLQKIRIAEAKRLLVETDRQISDIAHLVGFTSLNHFSRAFKNSVGTPPSLFRAESE